MGSSAHTYFYLLHHDIRSIVKYSFEHVLVAIVVCRDEFFAFATKVVFFVFDSFGADKVCTFVWD